ncbi:MAG: methyltransferase [Halieaceae bacterium]|jgi:predicted methyltransferase|nr:methyltransferase [Halieaceae bacterium]
MHSKSLALLLTLLFLYIPVTGAQSRTVEKIQDALALDYRYERERDRDDNRDPVAALEFMGLRDDMRVFEFGPGAGWYTKILAPVLKDEGELIVGYAEEWLAELDPFSDAPEMEKVRRVNMDMGWDDDEQVYTFNEIDFESSKLDMFLNIRNYHNLSLADRDAFNTAVFKALKRGGKFVIIDHTRRHMQPDDFENWRREDPVRVLTEVMQAGFVLEKYSDMFYRPDDTLAYEVGRKTVTGNTDRFFFVFEKP